MEGWEELSRCKGFPTDWWYPEYYAGISFRQRRINEKDAKAVCNVCPVKLQCLAEAMKNEETDGIWGGMSHIERRELKHKLRRSKL